MPRTQDARASPRAVTTAKQPYRILVASTGEPSSLGAIRVALALARRKSASVHVLTVTTAFPRGAPSAIAIAPPALVDDGNRRAALEAVRRQLAPVRGTTNWTMRAAVGWPADCIVDAGERWPASLIVVGIGEHGALDRLIGSETAVAIARRSRIPVLAVPHDVLHLPTRAVAGIDFTDSSVSAAMLAAALLGPNGVLTLVHASTLIKTDSEPGTLLDVYTAGAAEKLDEIRNRIHRQTKHQVQSVVVRGEIVERLMSYVEREECDLVALGGHEQGLIDRFLFGSVRTRMVRHAQCPVLVGPHAVAET